MLRTKAFYIRLSIPILLLAICMSFIRPAYTRQLINTLRSPALRANPAVRASGFTLPFALFGTSASKSNEMSDHPVKKSESEWQAILSPEQVS